jgi:putative serine protease PepD
MADEHTPGQHGDAAEEHTKQGEHRPDSPSGGSPSPWARPSTNTGPTEQVHAPDPAPTDETREASGASTDQTRQLGAAPADETDSSGPPPIEQEHQPEQSRRPDSAPAEPFRDPGQTAGSPYPAAYPDGEPEAPGSKTAVDRPARVGRRNLLTTAAMLLIAALIGGVIGGVVVRYGGVGGAGADDASTGAPTILEQVAQRTLPTVVQLRVTSGREAGAGSGMVLSPDGLILTNNHVIEMAAGGAGKITAMFQDGRMTGAEIVGRDPHSDVALVRARNVNGLTPITLGDSDSVRVGEQVMAIGSPLGLGGTVTTGIVSALNRAVSVGGDDDTPNLPGLPPPNGLAPQRPLVSHGEVLDAIQTDASINPGNSGGPLVDLQGRVVGINTAIASFGGDGEQSGSVGLGFSIPINQAKRIIGQIQRDGHATYPVIRATVQSVSPLDAPTGPLGAKVVDVAPGGPAAQAGLKPNDVVVKLDNRTVTTSDELVAAIGRHAPGDTVTLTLSDGRTLRVVLAGQPVLASK